MPLPRNNPMFLADYWPSNKPEDEHVLTVTSREDPYLAYSSWLIGPLDLVESSIAFIDVETPFPEPGVARSLPSIDQSRAVKLSPYPRLCVIHVWGPAKFMWRWEV